MLQNVTIFITGASRGLGRALALHFARKGIRLVLLARTKAKLDDTAHQAEIRGATVCPILADLADKNSLVAAAERLQAEKTPLDIIIHNAADTTSKPFRHTTLEEIDHLFRTNVTGMLQLTRLVIPDLLRDGKGTVVMISSLAGYKANPSQTVYSISKAGVRFAAEALAAEFRTSGIHIMCAAVPSIGSGNHPLKIDHYANRLERAIERKENEVFFTRTSALLMRLYGLLPELKRLV